MVVAYKQRLRPLLVHAAVLILLALPLASGQILYLGNEMTLENEDPTTFCGATVLYPMHRADAIPEDGKAYGARSASANSCGVNFVYEAQESFSLRGDLTLNLVVGCDVPTVYTGTAVTSSGLVRLIKNGGVVGDDIRFNDAFGPCVPGALLEVPVSVPGGSTSFAVGDTLGIFVILFGPSFGAHDVPPGQFYQIGASGSNLVGSGLPAPAAPAGNETGSGLVPETFYHDVAEESLEITLGFDEPTSDTYVYNWTSDLAAVDVALNATVENGSATLTVVDGNGTTLMVADLDGNLTETEPFEDVAPGAWNITVAYDDFVGELSLKIGAVQDVGTDGGTGQGSDADQDPDGADLGADGDDGGNASAATEEKSKGLPGPAPILILVALALVAALRRR